MECIKCGAKTKIHGYTYGFCNKCTKVVLHAEQVRIERTEAHYQRIMQERKKALTCGC